MEPPADALVHGLKYGGWEGLARPMGRKMARLVPSLPALDPVVVPVPTSKRRERSRGYNQARVLAEVVAGIQKLPLLDALVRPKGGTQVRLGPEARGENIKGAFRTDAKFSSRIEGREVILIDDVLTTGATAVSASLALTDSGASRVHLLAFARALPYALRRAG
jgi:ComF family protein